MKVDENKIEGVCIVEMHLNGGFTKVLLEKTRGIGLADGGIYFDIPTIKIPFHLRNIHTRFYLIIEKDNWSNIVVEEIKEK